MSAPRLISLRGVEVHNLRKIDLDLPHRQLIVLCGVSGSGKSSLAFDTLYAEGQRRYIETFSAYTRQFLERLEKPTAERIDGLPPAIAVGRQSPSRSSRATIGTATETADYLRLLYAKIGQVICQSCGQPVQRESPQSAAELLTALPTGTRFMISFAATSDATAPADSAAPSESATAHAQQADVLREEGFSRVIFNDRTLTLEEYAKLDESPTQTANRSPLYVVVDRLAAGSTTRERLVDSLEICFAKGDGAARVWIEPPTATAEQSAADAMDSTSVASSIPPGDVVSLDGRPWNLLTLSTLLRCERTALNFVQRLSGVATLASQFVQAVAGTKCKVLDTRKTTPGLRILEKMAAAAGGVTNHRMGLFDAILIKNNHITAAGGVSASLAAVRNQPIPAEIEVRTVEELDEALAGGATRLLLDNLTPEEARQWIERIQGRATVELSGGITMESVAAYAETGADFVSCGAITHSARAMDLNFRVELLDAQR